MNREIKFRAWDKLDKKIYDVGHIGFGKETQHVFLNIPNLYPNNTIISSFRKIKDIELMQYTGLKDVNYKEIFEGDIVKYPVHYWDGRETEWLKGKVEFLHGFFCVTNLDGSHDTLNIHDKELIGNIHENPELWDEK